jgi:hypothetical protein
MNIRANSTFRAGDFSRLEALLVPRLLKGAQAGADAVLAISQERVPVDTGKLKASGGTSVEWVGHKVSGYISYSAPYAAYVEFGIRQRGAAGEWAGPYSYSEGKGFAGFGYCRSSLDVGRSQVIAAFQVALGV